MICEDVVWEDVLWVDVLLEHKDVFLVDMLLEDELWEDVLWIEVVSSRVHHHNVVRKL